MIARLAQLFAFVIITIQVSGSPLCAQDRKTVSRERAVMTSVAAFLEQVHLAGLPLDDRLSRRAFDRFLADMDPLKLYFLRSDVDEFSKKRESIDDMMKRGMAQFANDVHGRYVKRVAERMALAEKLLGAKFDFTLDETFITDREVLTYSRNQADVKSRWRLRVKSDLLSLKADEVEDKEAIDRLTKRYRKIKERVAELDREDILSSFVNAVASCYDPHTSYMSPKAYQDFEMGLTLNYQGIGALLGEADDGRILIRRVIPGGAIAKYKKIKDRDYIIAVGQGPKGPLSLLAGMRMKEVVKLIRGDEGTIIRLSIAPAAGGAEEIHHITRARIELEDSAAESEVITMKAEPGAKAMKIGVIDLPSFYRDGDAERDGQREFRSSARDLSRILGEFKTKGVDGVVLDLRRNGGGFLPEAVEVAGLFIDKGCVVQVKGSNRRVRKLDDEVPGLAWSGPLVVLISKGSASASEIVAGAIRDFRRGIIVGDASTHGKGSVQVPVDIAEQIEYPGGPGTLGVLKLTLRKFYCPNGDSTQLRGVLADVEVPSWTNAMEIGESELDNPLPFDRIKAARIKANDDLDDRMLTVLRKSSAARRRVSPYFLALGGQLDAYTRFLDRKSIPLQEEAYKELQKQLNAGQEAMNEESETEEAKGPYLRPWFREILDITADYVDLLQKKRAS